MLGYFLIINILSEECVCVCSVAQLYPALCDFMGYNSVLQAPLSMGSSRQEYWSGLPFPPPGDLPDPGIKPASPRFPTLKGGFFIAEPPGKPSLKNGLLY